MLCRGNFTEGSNPSLSVLKRPSNKGFRSSPDVKEGFFFGEQQ
jgi:hypothetical protein